MCPICIRNFLHIYGERAMMAAVAAGGAFSPGEVLRCEHTAQQREDFLEDERNRYADLVHRARKEVLR